MKTIKLTKGYETIVDDEDFEYLNQWKWHFSHGYAKRHAHIKGSGRKNAKQITIYMHNLINRTPMGLCTDHINRDRLDNRRVNLRTVPQEKNLWNLSLSRKNTSGYKGVSFLKNRNKWESYIWKKNKKIHLGEFIDIEEAIAVRKQAEGIYHAI